MKDLLIMLVNKAEEIKKEKNISLLEAYNLVLTDYDFSSFSVEQLRSLIMILKTELSDNDDKRPFIAKMTLISSAILNVIVICLGNLIPIEAIRGLWYVFFGYCTYKSLVLATNRWKAAKNNKKRQYTIAEYNINALIELAYNEAVSQDVKEELTKDNNKCTEKYISKLLKAIEELIPLVSYDKISSYSMECLRLRSAYNNIFKKSDVVTLRDIDIYNENPELLVQQLESLLDSLIEDTSPASVSNMSLGDKIRRTNKK